MARHRPARARLAAAVLAAGALLAACSSSSSGAPASTPSTGADGTGTGGTGTGGTGTGGRAGGPPATADPAELAARLAASKFATTACDFEVPSGTTPRCGTVTVPLDWATGTGEMKLAVAVFPGSGKQAAADPVVYLDGGPGSDTLDTAQYLADDLLDPLVDRGDVILFDQRGAGRSKPSLDCPEVIEATRTTEHTPKLSDDAAEANLQAGLKACRARLEGQGVDIAAFNTINNAHDVEAIRVALGYDHWNIYGISYGTRLALEVLRQHPQAVRSAVIDSVYPPEDDSTRSDPAGFVASYRAVVAACAAEPACAAKGDLAQRFKAVVAAYDAKPVQVKIQDIATKGTDQVWVNGATIINVVMQSLYSPTEFTDLPELVGELETGRTRAIEQFLSQSRAQEGLFTTGMFYAFECNEEVPFAQLDQVTASLPADPFGRKAKFDYADNEGTLAFGTCGAWGMGQPDPSANQPVFSDVPTLVMSGAYDPVTPPEWAREAASHLSHGFLVSAPAGAHGVSPGDCGMSVVRQFLDAPTKAPDGSCLAKEKLRFISSSDAAPVELVPASYPSLDGGSTIATVRPKGWTGSATDGEWVRQSSFLDPTEIVQLAGSRIQLAGLEAFIANTMGLTLPKGEQVSRNGRSWLHRNAANADTAVEWYQADIGGHTVVVILVAEPAELDTVSAAVLTPALDKITVS